jgi:hypothetical protein
MKGKHSFSTLLPGVPQVAQVSFGSIFAVVPKASVIWSGANWNSYVNGDNVGWTVTLDQVTTSGARIAVQVVFLQTSLISFQYVATQGDHLQVFLL